MHKIDVLVTSELSGGQDSFCHGELNIVFHKWSGRGELPLLEGTPWAFVDWLLPTISGLEVCRRLRCDPLTALANITLVVPDDEQTKRLALRGGADNYIVGPIDRRLILDRVLATKLKHSENSVRHIIQIGDLIVDLTAFQARWKNTPVRLRPSEFRLLRYFAEHPGRVFTRSQIIDALGKQDFPLDERTVDVWVGRMRRALRAAGADEYFRTVRQLGYVLDDPQFRAS